MDPKFSSDMMLLEDSDDAGWTERCHFNTFWEFETYPLDVKIYIYIDSRIIVDIVYIYIHVTYIS